MLIANCSYAQKVYEFSYSNKDFDIAKLTISEDSFKLESIFSMIKPKGGSNIYHFAEKSDGNYVAKKATADDFLEIPFFFFTYKGTDTLLKIDTVYHNMDTLINGFSCKKVMISYVRGGIDVSGATVNNKIVPLDTLVSTLYVTPLVSALTPFSFVSNTTKGLIIERKFPRTEYVIENEKVVKIVDERRVFTDIRKIDNLNDNFFKLPKMCKYVKTYLEFIKIAGEELSRGVAGISQDN